MRLLLLAFAFLTWSYGAQAQYPPAVAPLVGLLEARTAALVAQVGLAGPLVNAAAFNNPVPIPTNNSLPLPSLADAQYYMLFSGAVYCYGSQILTSWTCDYCKATGPNVRFHSTMFNATTQIAGMININDAERKIIVTFRGSYAAQNFVVDTLFPPVPFVGANEGVRVHTGFLYLMNSIYPQMRAKLLELNQQYPDYTFVFGGHSLGSALAMLNLVKFLATEPDFQGKGNRFSLFSYAGIRVGDHAFAHWANSMNFTAARIVNYADLVPHLLPPTNVYTHFATEYWIDTLGSNHTRICASNVTEDPSCSNSLAPVYDLAEHFWYYNVSYFQCLVEDPVNGAIQIA